jgi:hypothetical protein
MIERFDKRMISDFRAFFCEPWCAGLLHDRFRKFFDLLHQEIAGTKDVNTVEVHTAIREALLTFLIENDDLLPAYFTAEAQIPPLPGPEDDQQEAPASHSWPSSRPESPHPE